MASLSWAVAVATLWYELHGLHMFLITPILWVVKLFLLFHA